MCSCRRSSSRLLGDKCCGSASSRCRVITEQQRVREGRRGAFRDAPALVRETVESWIDADALRITRAVEAEERRGQIGRLLCQLRDVLARPDDGTIRIVLPPPIIYLSFYANRIHYLDL